MQSTTATVAAPAVVIPRTQALDWLVLDMDGTLLDLSFDNYFWLELVPARYAQLNRLSLAAARLELAPRFAAQQGKLDWYCTDFWSRELALNIAALKREASAHVRFLPDAELFLRAVRKLGLRTVLATNAHHDSLAIKAEQTRLTQYFDVVVSSHSYGVPKEHPEFWLKLHANVGFDPARTLFIDDSLAVLRAARRHGIAHLLAISQPDSTQPPRTVTEFAAVESVAGLLRLWKNTA
jgi:putative hydrolase of the HAD superfamily